jgi:hypothetical protein
MKWCGSSQNFDFVHLSTGAIPLYVKKLEIKKPLLVVIGKPVLRVAISMST